jgi:hypothetical protein
MNEELRESPTLVSHFIVDELSKYQYFTIKSNRKQLLQMVGLATYFVAKTSVYAFIDEFPLTLFTKKEIVTMKSEIKEYLSINTKLTSAKKRDYMLKHSITKFGKVLFNSSLEEPFWFKVTGRRNIVIHQMDKFMTYLHKMMDRVEDM